MIVKAIWEIVTDELKNILPEEPFDNFKYINIHYKKIFDYSTDIEFDIILSRNEIKYLKLKYLDYSYPGTNLNIEVYTPKTTIRNDIKILYEVYYTFIDSKKIDVEVMDLQINGRTYYKGKIERKSRNRIYRQTYLNHCIKKIYDVSREDFNYTISKITDKILQLIINNVNKCFIM